MNALFNFISNARATEVSSTYVVDPDSALHVTADNHTVQEVPSSDVIFPVEDKSCLPPPVVNYPVVYGNVPIVKLEITDYDSSISTPHELSEKLSDEFNQELINPNHMFNPCLTDRRFEKEIVGKESMIIHFMEEDNIYVDRILGLTNQRLSIGLRNDLKVHSSISVFVQSHSDGIEHLKEYFTLNNTGVTLLFKDIHAIKNGKLTSVSISQTKDMFFNLEYNRLDLTINTTNGSLTQTIINLNSESYTPRLYNINVNTPVCKRVFEGSL